LDATGNAFVHRATVGRLEHLTVGLGHVAENAFARQAGAFGRAARGPTSLAEALVATVGGNVVGAFRIGLAVVGAIMRTIAIVRRAIGLAGLAVTLAPCRVRKCGAVFVRHAVVRAVIGAGAASHRRAIDLGVVAGALVAAIRRRKRSAATRHH